MSSGFEVRKTGVTRFDLNDPYHIAVSLSWPAFTLLSLAALFAINLAFALLYLAQPGCVQNLPPGSIPYALFFSLETLGTVGYGEMAPTTVYGHSVAAAEIVVGMALVAIMTGILFVRFSRPRPKILFASHAVVARHDGKPTLMLRIANGRMTNMAETRARLGALVLRTTTEGHSFRGIQDLALVRDNLPFFPLTWTLMHVLDETSPLTGYDSERLKADDVRLFLTIRGMDLELNAEVRDIQDYDAPRILFGKRYADAVSRDDTGRTTGNLSRLSWTEDDV